ncbi:MAG: Crp/Fnr family transcriptional regulator [Methylotenera sp.]
MEKALIAHQLSKFHLFSELQPAQIERLVSSTQLINLLRGTTLFNRGDNAHGFYLLLEGQIKLGVISPHGDEKVIGLVQPDQSFGEAVMFLERPFPIYAQAILDSQVLLIAKNAIFNILESDVTVVRRMLAGISARNRQLVNDIATISLQNSMQRMIGYLLKVSAESTNNLNFQLPANKLTVASILNITPETFSRILLRLQDAELIRVNGRDITITNLNGLKDFR